MGNITIVVARYKENLEWLSEIDNHVDIVVYNKGPDDFILPRSAKVVQLPNEGRETHTYFSHIVDNYKTMSGQLVFVQGHAKSHYFDFCHVINTLDADVEWMNLGIPFIKASPDVPARLYWEYLFPDHPVPYLNTHGIGMQCVTTAKGLRTRSKDFYSLLINEAIKSPVFSDGVVWSWFGYFVELYLPYLFSGYDYDTVRQKTNEWLKEAWTMPEELKPMRIY